MAKAKIRNCSDQGLTLIETIVAIGIFSLATVAIMVFISQGFKAQKQSIQNIIAQQEIRRALKIMSKEIRGAAESAEGDYAIDTAQGQSLTFYTNIDDDVTTERVRYFLDGTELKRGLTQPSGEPPTYGEDEEISILARYVNNESTPIFTYYDTNYTGTEDPLPLPADIGEIRLIHIHLIIDVDPEQPPEGIILETEATLRNLKENL